MNLLFWWPRRYFCPMCQAKTARKIVHYTDIPVFGETFSVLETIYKCACGESWWVGGFDPFELAYRAYRRKHGWLTARQIRRLRGSRSLESMGLETGICWKRLRGYELGSLQTAEHELILRGYYDRR